jgi:hypothetical protein
MSVHRNIGKHFLKGDIIWTDGCIVAIWEVTTAVIRICHTGAMSLLVEI